LAACGAGQLPAGTPQPPQVVREIVYATVEVPRIEREVQYATVYVTVVVRETVVVTPAAPPEWRVSVDPGISLGLPRTWHSATRGEDGSVLLAGGSNGADEHYNLVDIYDPVSGALSPSAPLNTPRSGHTATRLGDGRVLVVGGYNAGQGWLADAEIFDPATGAWTVLPPLYSHGVQHSATLLADGRVLVAGGCIASGVCTDRMEIFDPQANSWMEAAPLASDLGSHAALLLDDGRVLVAGGAGSRGTGGGQVYDPLANTWSATGKMIQPRAQAPMVKLADGRALTVGGLVVSENPLALASAEIYDPRTNTWTEAGGLAQPRYAHSLVLLADGQVLALGGARSYDYPAGHPGGSPWSADALVRPLEVYDPVGKRWYTAGELAQPQAYAGTAWLPDGRLWVTGGGAGADMAKAWAETWLLSLAKAQP
jgi:hypothetical protein